MGQYTPSEILVRLSDSFRKPLPLHLSAIVEAFVRLLLTFIPNSHFVIMNFDTVTLKVSF